MSISEISAASALPVRRRARMSAMAASAFGLGALFIEVSSSSERPLTTGTWGITASGEAPRTRPSSSIQWRRSEEHTSELQSRSDLVCRPLLEQKNDLLFLHAYNPCFQWLNWLLCTSELTF